MAVTSFRRDLLGRTYLMPLIIAVVSSAGLLFALIGDGVWDYLSWLALGFPVAIGLSKRRASHGARRRFDFMLSETKRFPEHLHSANRLFAKTSPPAFDQ